MSGDILVVTTMELAGIGDGGHNVGWNLPRPIVRDLWKGDGGITTGEAGGSLIVNCPTGHVSYGWWTRWTGGWRGIVG
ncbi:hypothetical protein HanRHA438_Chr16g0762541 [Helianthus annuus]|nr:hypothetical protein HanRHA438_Chr16g0762541 [Helianthus annuus]